MTAIINNGTSLIATNCTNDLVWDTAGTSSTYTIQGNVSANGSIYIVGDNADQWMAVPSDKLQLPDYVREVVLKDGAVLHVDAQGNYRLEDKDAKVIYQAHRNRDFNPYVNAGDLVAKFIDFVRQSVPGVKRTDVPTLPLQLFVHWLILQAAERDGDPVPVDVVPVPNSRLLVARIRPRCRWPRCQRFIARAIADAGFNYCNPDHAMLHRKLLAA